MTPSQRYWDDIEVGERYESPGRTASVDEIRRRPADVVRIGSASGTARHEPGTDVDRRLGVLHGSGAALHASDPEPP
jgi:hypothetical protein